MWNPRRIGERRQGEGLVALAVDKDKSSQYALKWAVENFLPRDRTIKLVHVNQRIASSHPNPGNGHTSIQQHQDAPHIKEVMLPFRCFCIRRQVQFEIVVLHDPDVAKALIEYVSLNGVDTLLLGASSRNSISRLFMRNSDVPSSVMKWTPDFCNVYIISKGKANTIRPASRPVPVPIILAVERARSIHPDHLNDETAEYDMLSARGRAPSVYDELSAIENDISFLSPGRSSTDSTFLSFYQSLGSESPRGSPKVSYFEDGEFEPLFSTNSDMVDHNTDQHELSSSGNSSFLLQEMADMEYEMRRTKIELKQTTEMYHAACKEALASKQKAIEVQEWKLKEEQRLKEVEASALAFVDKEKAKYEAAIETAHRFADQDLQKRILNLEMKALIESEEKKIVLDALGQSHIALKYQSLFHILAVFFLFYFYFYFYPFT
ncbi:U-box domain-containing protein 35 [Quillaja saponaria]|uniref:RING-type E3 ubiquitin transferase n=1 Tax=Quillaja saponaria TaxID=32244 RepID=A0AAD7Q2K3_QUISA|nr:U-box domain-containing protein 35 [Quillaja saponaria]